MALINEAVQLVLTGLMAFSPSVFLDILGCLRYPYEFFNPIVYLQNEIVDIFLVITCKLLIYLGSQHIYIVEFFHS